jgi:hypothetical protein
MMEQSTNTIETETKNNIRKYIYVKNIFNEYIVNVYFFVILALNMYIVNYYIDKMSSIDINEICEKKTFENEPKNENTLKNIKLCLYGYDFILKKLLFGKKTINFLAVSNSIILIIGIGIKILIGINQLKKYIYELLNMFISIKDENNTYWSQHIDKIFDNTLPSLNFIQIGVYLIPSPIYYFIFLFSKTPLIFEEFVSYICMNFIIELYLLAFVVLIMIIIFFDLFSQKLELFFRIITNTIITIPAQKIYSIIENNLMNIKIGYDLDDLDTIEKGV